MILLIVGLARCFSGVTFISLGYGDVVLTGLLMFAIATAVLIAVIQRLFIRDRP